MIVGTRLRSEEAHAGRACAASLAPFAFEGWQIAESVLVTSSVERSSVLFPECRARSLSDRSPTSRPRARLEKLAAAADDQRFIASAPAALVFCAVPRRSGAVHGERGAALFAPQDATIACAYAQLAATSLGLGSVWIGSFDPAAVAAAIDATAEAIPIAILPIGHPAENGEPTTRRPLDETVRNVT